jgi:phenylacetyl-CoA:acceptor oxidoreductase subunit 2
MLVQIGTVLPLAVVIVALLLGEAVFYANALAAVAVLATGWRFKLALVTRAAFNQGFSLPHLPVRGTR